MIEVKIKDLNLHVNVIPKPRNRRIYIRVKENNIINITTPIKLDNKKIEKYLNNSYDFIKKTIERMNKKEEIKISNKLHLFGQEYEIKEIIDDELSYVICDGQYIIIHKKENEDAAKLVHNYYKECLSHFVNRYIEEAKTALHINKVINVNYKNVKTYFGICKPKENKVGFSTKLCKYEPILIKSVIYHELAHFYFLNHQDGFYKILENAFPNYKYYQHKLRMLKYDDKY